MMDDYQIVTVIYLNHYLLIKMASTSERTKVSVGDLVTLSKGGRGAKRKFNGRRCVVTDYPRTGSWMTVQLLPNDRNGKDSKRDVNIKWRKRSYSRHIVAHAQRDKVDPMKLLDGCDHIWANILSYCAEHGVQHDGMWIKDAVKIHRTMSLVSKKWKKSFADPMYRYIGSINADLDALKSETVIPAIKWMCQYGSYLSSLKVQVRYNLIPIIQKLLQETNTRTLVNMRFGYGNQGDIWVDSCYDKFFGTNYSVIDLCTNDPGPTFQEKTEALDMPSAMGVSNQELGQRLQECIAFHCPNLRSLSWNFAKISNTEVVNSPIFSLSSLTHLELGMHFDHWVQREQREYDDLNIITRMIQNLGNLQHLKIKFDIYSMSSKKIQIHSQSLRYLDVSEMSKSCFVACICPLLEVFICKGGGYGNGSMPILTEEEIDAYKEKYRGKTLVQCQSQMQLPGMDIPDSCKCILKNFAPIMYIQKKFIELGTAE